MEISLDLRKRHSYTPTIHKQYLISGNANVCFEESRVSAIAIEEKIQKLETGLSPLINFMLSGSGLLSAQIQFARALVRIAL